jgi:hypothetical protein
MMRLLAGAIALICSQSADALSIRFEFPGAVQSSAAVARIEIERAEQVATPAGQSCGTRYRAKVVEGFKGIPTGGHIEFGYSSGRAVGAQYFVFLRATAGLAPASAASGRTLMTGPVPYIADCRDLLPPYVETAEGMGTIPIRPGEHVSNEPAVTFGDPMYAIPANLPGAYWHLGHVVDGRLVGSVQISAVDFSTYLRTLLASP